MQTDVRAQRIAWSDEIEIAVIQRGDGGVRAIGRLTMEQISPTMSIGSPTLRLENDEAQFLMDELWRCGLRPSEGTGSAGSLAATEKHLSDMRKIVAKKLDVIF